MRHFQQKTRNGVGWGMEEQLLEGFIAAVRANHHLLPLLPRENWILGINIDNNQWILSFSREEIGIAAERTPANSILHCSLQDWLGIINGEQKLRQLLKMGSTFYEGTFRSLLMLESIFFLCSKKMVRVM